MKLYGDGTNGHTLAARILDLLDLNAPVDPKSLSPADELHVGGRAATSYLVASMGLGADMRVLDAGCGLGGVARYIAGETGAHVHGVDLSHAYIQAAGDLSAACALSAHTDFTQGDVCDLPLPKRGAYDAALTLHVGMNIRDKRAFYASVHNALKPGALFGIYDVLRRGDGADLSYPMPWARDRGESWLADRAEMQNLLESTGFTVEDSEDRSDFAVDGFVRMRKAYDNPRFQAVSRLVRGDDWQVQMDHIALAVERRLCAPFQILARRL